MKLHHKESALVFGKATYGAKYIKNHLSLSSLGFLHILLKWFEIITHIPEGESLCKMVVKFMVFFGSRRKLLNDGSIYDLQGAKTCLDRRTYSRMQKVDQLAMISDHFICITACIALGSKKHT